MLAFSEASRTASTSWSYERNSSRFDRVEGVEDAAVRFGSVTITKYRSRRPNARAGRSPAGHGVANYSVFGMSWNGLSRSPFLRGDAYNGPDPERSQNDEQLR
jgi:hypothetical protein